MEFFMLFGLHISLACLFIAAIAGAAFIVGELLDLLGGGKDD